MKYLFRIEGIHEEAKKLICSVTFHRLSHRLFSGKVKKMKV
jgi:hypothetical protein